MKNWGRSNKFTDLVGNTGQNTGGQGRKGTGKNPRSEHTKLVRNRRQSNEEHERGCTQGNKDNLAETGGRV